MKNALLILLALLAGFIGAYLVPSASSTAQKETAFERVMRTGTLRCGYGVWAPGLTKDAQTGQLSGIFYDYLNGIGQHTGLKVEWTTEVGWADFPAALNSGRIDAMCFGAWPKATVARDTIFTQSIYYLPVLPYVRADDTRFDDNIAAANDPAITFSTMDAEISSEIARVQFPKAQTVSMPQISQQSSLLLNVALKKADITFTDAWTAADYMKANPGQLKVVAGAQPARLFGHTIPLALGEHNLASLLNAATDEMRGTGELDAIIAKYASIPGVLLTEKPAYK